MTSYFSRNVPKEARGIFFALSFFIKFIGKLISYKVSEYIFPIAAYWPFVFDSIFFFLMGFMLIVAFTLGYYEKRIDKIHRSILVASILEGTSKVS